MPQDTSLGINSRYKDVNPRYLVKDSDVIKSGLNAINSSLENIFGTSRGERTFIPQFGSDLTRLLFEPINDETAQNIFFELMNNIEEWEPRIIVEPTESYVRPIPDHNLYEVMITYRLRDNVEVTGQFNVTVRT